MKKIKNSHILIIGPGSSINLYKKKIFKFIEKNKPVIIGLNHISNFIKPHYQAWGDVRRFKEFGSLMDKGVIGLFPFPIFSSEIIKEKWMGEYKKIKYKNSKYVNNKDFYKYKTTDIKPIKKEYSIRCQNGIIYGRFRTIGCLIILWVYLKKTKKIDIIGMDGYTLFNKEDYDKGIQRQHCYNINLEKYEDFKKSGYSDIDTFCEKNNYEKKKENKNKFYEFCIEKDRDIYTDLKQIKNYGVEFNILTPTIYKDFYDPEVL